MDDKTPQKQIEAQQRQIEAQQSLLTAQQKQIADQQCQLRCLSNLVWSLSVQTFNERHGPFYDRVTWESLKYSQGLLTTLPRDCINMVENLVLPPTVQYYTSRNDRNFIGAAPISAFLAKGVYITYRAKFKRGFPLAKNNAKLLNIGNTFWSINYKNLILEHAWEIPGIGGMDEPVTSCTSEEQTFGLHAGSLYSNKIQWDVRATGFPGGVRGMAILDSSLVTISIDHARIINLDTFKQSSSFNVKHSNSFVNYRPLAKFTNQTCLWINDGELSTIDIRMGKVASAAQYDIKGMTLISFENTVYLFGVNRCLLTDLRNPSIVQNGLVEGTLRQIERIH